MTTLSTAWRAALTLLGLTPLTNIAAPSPAYALVMHGRVAEAEPLLDAALDANPNDGPARLLLCRANLAQELPDPAVTECERAAATLPASSEAQMWLGRALGLKAAHSNPISAIALAKRVRASFERAVELNPKDLAASSDLAEFYIGAPSMVGGSPQKATALANAVLTQSPAKGHRLLALIEEKDYSEQPAAEVEYKLAIAAGHTPEAWSDLALFYQRHKRYDEALAAGKQALAADISHGPVEADIASILTDAKRGPDTAIAALRAYLGSPNQTDAAPVFKVRVQLGTLLLKRGDKDGAKYEFTSAATLAPHFEAARKALASL